MLVLLEYDAFVFKDSFFFESKDTLKRNKYAICDFPSTGFRNLSSSL